MNRPGFEYGCECGYWTCLDCGTPWYPMEVESNNDGVYECPECLGPVGFHPHKKQKLSDLLEANE